MPDISQDIAAIVIGEVFSDGALYGVTPDGQLVEIFDPTDTLLADYAQAELYPLTPVAVDGSLYFAVGLFDNEPVSQGGRADLQLMRITPEGNVEEVAFVAQASLTNYGFNHDQLPLALGMDGNLLLQVVDLSAFQATGVSSTRVLSFAPDGTVETLLDITRPNYPGASPGMALLDGTVFVIGDQRTPQGPVELWRVRPDGTQQFVYSDGVNTISGLQVAGNRAFFVVQDLTPNDSYRALFSITATGIATQVDLGDGILPWTLDRSGDSLFVTYSYGLNDTSIYLGLLDGLGNLTPLASDTGNAFVDVARLGDTVFVTDFRGRLYRVTDAGDLALVEGFATGLFEGGAQRMVVSDGRLYLQGIALVDDGFGGQAQVAGFYVVDETGPAQVLSAFGGGTDVSVLSVYSFTLDVPDPVIGTPQDDPNLTGTAFAELIDGRGGNDTLRGLGGNDTLLGGTGNDRLDGGAGNDIYIVDSTGDRVTGEIGFASGGGIDTVFTSVNFTAPANVEIIRAVTGTTNLNLTGNDAPNTIVGNAGANVLLGRGGNDLINGGDGADSLTGGMGRDTLAGGNGADVFVYTAIAESRAGGLERDFINGFTHGSDRINLSAIDANTRTTGVNDAFVFIGAAAFSGTGAASAGQLRMLSLGGANAVIVAADHNGDGLADFQIFVNLTNFMTGTDFIL